MKTPKEQKLITRQISRKLQRLKELKEAATGVNSWIDYVRTGLGMSLVQLARRTGVSQASLSSSIKLEREGRITLNKLKEIADAMGCDLVYEFVPRKNLEDMMWDQAMKKTLHLINETETHMALEDQKVELDKNERVKELAEERRFSKHLWD
ncbi:MAG: helix-turn-helix domain-containing protein [Bacteriovoracaceae bacterium]